jgi:hypothetical protein
VKVTKFIMCCQECGQEFDLSKADEANNFYYGHDCEPKPKSTDVMYDVTLTIKVSTTVSFDMSGREGTEITPSDAIANALGSLPDDWVDVFENNGFTIAFPVDGEADQIGRWGPPRMRCPCCKAPSPRGSQIAWCDVCNTDSGPCCQGWTDEDYEQERADLLNKERIEDALHDQ